MHQTQCSQHGLQDETFVCQHIVTSLRTGEPVGFWWSTKRDMDRPDAWCSACRDRLAEAGDWTPEAEAFANPTILCGQCYDDVRNLNLTRRHDLSWQIVEASSKDDRRAGRDAYRRLSAFVRDQTRRRRSHPYIIEALADFTETGQKAIALYRRALRLARRRGIPGQTILLELARHQFAIKGGQRLARRYLRASLEEAFRMIRRRRMEQSGKGEELGNAPIRPS